MASTLNGAAKIEDTHAKSQTLDLNITQAKFELAKETNDIKKEINTDRKSAKDTSENVDDEEPQGSSGQVTYIVDKGLVTFGKFAVAILAMFLTVGVFLYGLDIKQLTKQMQDTLKQIQDTHVASQKLDLDIKRAQLDLEEATADIKKDVESAKADIKKSVESAEASAKEASETSSRMRDFLNEAEQSKQHIQQYENTLLALPPGSKQVPAAQASQTAPDPGQLERLIDARLLETLKNVLVPEQYSALKAQIAVARGQGLRRQIFDAKNTTDLPGDLVRKEGDAPISDPIANEAYDNFEVVYRFFKDVFGRDSLDNHGKALVASIHYLENYNNAFWNGQQMIFGDGDGVIFQRFTALDMIAYELTHGVTQFTAQLAYQDQPGALNNSISAVFASMVKQWALEQTVDQADWLIGASILAPDFKGRALQDMANPGTAYDDPRLGKDPQPGDMKDYVQTAADNGGVHTNSGIPNRAFVLAAKAIGGHSWEKTGKIWYVTLTERLTGNDGFEKCARETVSVARDLFPRDPSIAAKVAKAWADVGVLEERTTASGAPKVKR
jgi:Zn-dependent metalloprotease